MVNALYKEEEKMIHHKNNGLLEDCNYKTAHDKCCNAIDVQNKLACFDISTPSKFT